jgi:hypothetical protein
LAPFIIKAPDEMKKKTGIAYLTCIHMDVTADKMILNNPVNHSYLVFGSTENPTSTENTRKIMRMHCNNNSVFDKYSSIDHYFVPIRNEQKSYTLDIMDVDHYDFYNTFYNDPKNKKELLNLIRIPLTFHKQRKPTFKVYLDYTFNLIEMMSEPLTVQKGVNVANQLKAQAQAQAQAKAKAQAQAKQNGALQAQGVVLDINNAKKNTKKSQLLRKIARTPVYDSMYIDKKPMIPRYLTIIKTSIDPKQPEPFNNTYMWNAKFNVNSLKTAIGSENRDDFNFVPGYYIDTLDNFVNIPYKLENAKPVIRLPFGEMVDVTKQHQIGTLLAKMLYNNALSLIPTEADKKNQIVRQYRLYDTYYGQINGQDSYIQNMFNMIKQFRTHYSSIDAVSIIQRWSEITDHDAKSKCLDKMRMVIACFYICFYIIFPRIQNIPYYQFLVDKNVYMTDAMTIQSLFEEEYDDERSVLETYSAILNDIVYALCYEGIPTYNSQYHFTELSKEFALLMYFSKEIDKKNITNPSKRQDRIIPTNMTPEIRHTILHTFDNATKQRGIQTMIKRQYNLQNMITLLNETFSYFNDNENEFKLQSLEDSNAHVETVPRAIEYVVKAGLVDMHKARVVGYIMTFEKFVKLIDLDKSIKAYYDDMPTDTTLEPNDQKNNNIARKNKSEQKAKQKKARQEAFKTLITILTGDEAYIDNKGDEKLLDIFLNYVSGPTCDWQLLAEVIEDNSINLIF